MNSDMPAHRRSGSAFLACLAVSSAVMVGTAGHGRAAGAPKPSLQVQVADSSVFGRREPAPIAASVTAAPRPAGLLPAPIPDQDIDDPALRAVASARLSPTLLSRSDVFEGNGYAPYSNLDHAIDERTPPAPGIKIMVPVK